MVRIPSTQCTFAIRVQLARNEKNAKMHHIDLYEGGLQLAENSTKNVSDNELNLRMKYIVVRLDN